MADLMQTYAIPFAAWDVRLYLDTHPDDPQALAAYRQLCAGCACRDNYACVPGSEACLDHWNWVNDPWPWEFEANCPQQTVPCGQCRQCRGNRARTNPCQRRM